MPRRGYTLIPTSPSPDGRGISPIDVRRSVLSSVSTLDPDVADEIEAEEDAHGGVAAVEAAEQVFGQYSKWFLFIGIGLASYVYSLDNQTTSNYLPWVTSDFGAHSLISSIQVVQSILIAVGKPIIAKVADVTSRATAYLVVLGFHVTGYLVIATAPSVGAVAVGIIFYAIGYTGLQLLTAVIIADITTLKWRGLVTGLTSAPFLVNAVIGSKLAHVVHDNLDGMFAIIVPVAMAPLILTLFWGERQAKKQGLVRPSHPHDDLVHHAKAKWMERAWLFAEQLDLVGLVLLGAAVALILLPMTLAQRAKGSWSNPSMVAMFILGWILLPVFALWDIKYAKRPVIARRFLSNRTVVCVAFIGFFDFLSFFLTFLYLPSFVFVTKTWSEEQVFYFGQAQTVGLTIFGILGGIIMRFTRRYKPLLVIGLCIRLLSPSDAHTYPPPSGVTLMIHSRGTNSSDAELVMTQVLQGLGGGFAAVCSGVGAQASVPHADVATVIAIVLLWTEIGAGVGSSLAGAIWAGTMPGKLREYLPELSQEERDVLFGDIKNVTERAIDDPVRVGVIGAYSDTMKVMLILAMALSVIPLVLSFFMPNWYLGDQQNAVEEADLLGRRNQRTSLAMERPSESGDEEDGPSRESCEEGEETL
ncbi:MFS general substrate transporter [Ganoderma sinense ZZ0214-1]|uniref:MFS general substrate transporter n=1 Tax=Ganoderma sinense ZZ0214-1 TaxID=1077348 RepID=A0A2G8S6T8_9APHY|nr:MFS general substrate transporter [Ganoderma sinense ZZ0214-1]